MVGHGAHHLVAARRAGWPTPSPTRRAAGSSPPPARARSSRSRKLWPRRPRLVTAKVSSPGRGAHVLGADEEVVELDLDAAGRAPATAGPAAAAAGQDGGREQGGGGAHERHRRRHCSVCCATFMASRRLLALPVIVAALALGACGSEGIELAEDDPNYEGARAVRRELRRAATRSTWWARRGRRPTSARASGATARTSTSARRPSRTCSTRSATAASRRSRCRRTSSPARTRRRWPSSSPSTRAAAARE